MERTAVCTCLFVSRDLLDLLCIQYQMKFLTCHFDFYHLQLKTLSNYIFCKFGWYSISTLVPVFMYTTNLHSSPRTTRPTFTANPAQHDQPLQLTQPNTTNLHSSPRTTRPTFTANPAQHDQPSQLTQNNTTNLHS